jgi:hypothetical protein
MANGNIWTKRDVECLADLWSTGMTIDEMSVIMRRSKGAISGVVVRHRRRGDARFALRGADLANRKPLPQREPPPPDPRQACFEHWRDLDRHHPRGWASYRIESEFRSTVRPSGFFLSIVGSSAATCAEA